MSYEDAWDLDTYNDDKHWYEYYQDKLLDNEQIEIMEQIESAQRIMLRTLQFKEELIAEFWKPSRVEKMLELGGWDLVDSY
jgi:hypothetical protein